MTRWAVIGVLGVLAAGCDVVFPPGRGPGADVDGPPGGDDAPPPDDGAPPDTGTLDADAVDASPGPDASFACPSSYLPIPGSASRYHFYGSMNWTDAIQRCLTDDAIMVPPGSLAHIHLVVLDDQAEMDAIVAMYGGFQVWIGLSDRIAEGSFKTVTTQDAAFPPSSGGPWGAGQPDDGGGVQDCVRIMNNTDFDANKLDDDDCTTEAWQLLCECDAYADDPSKY